MLHEQTRTGEELIYEEIDPKITLKGSNEYIIRSEMLKEQLNTEKEEKNLMKREY